jgi:hypothetical protein
MHDNGIKIKSTRFVFFFFFFFFFFFVLSHPNKRLFLQGKRTSGQPSRAASWPHRRGAQNFFFLAFINVAFSGGPAFPTTGMGAAATAKLAPPRPKVLDWMGWMAAGGFTFWRVL